MHYNKAGEGREWDIYGRIRKCLQMPEAPYDREREGEKEETERLHSL